jgi:predicted DNA-binding protein (UPF0251 family)/predicted Fe-Mo cluster-binding NifX family protein
MPRPSKCKSIAFIPGVTYFKPAGVPLRSLEEVRISLEEAEALRLKDVEGLEQEEGAVRMRVSRPTFQRVLASARRKVADALLNGKAVRIEGGNFEVVARRYCCANGHEWDAGAEGSTKAAMQTCPVCNAPSYEANRNKQTMNAGVGKMKIAAVSEDGTTISQHFGRAPYYVVLTIEGGHVVKKEKREKSTHHVAGQEHSTVAGQRHGFDAAAQSTHAGMMSNIADCQVVMAGGMGMGARESLKAAGIETVMTDLLDIDEAVSLYIAGRLPNRTERLH